MLDCVRRLACYTSSSGDGRFHTGWTGQSLFPIGFGAKSAEKKRPVTDASVEETRKLETPWRFNIASNSRLHFRPIFQLARKIERTVFLPIPHRGVLAVVPGLQSLVLRISLANDGEE